MTTVTATLAEQAAAAMGNDGSRLITPGGRTMDDVMEQFDATVVRDSDGDTHKYIFDDASVITVIGDMWDLGYQRCNCWRTNGHSRYCTDGLGRNDWHEMYITPESFTADVEYRIDNAELVEEIHRFFSDVQDFDAWVTLTRTGTADYPILAAFSNGRGGATTNGNCVWGEWGDYIDGDVLKLDGRGVDEQGRSVTVCIDEDGVEYHQHL